MNIERVKPLLIQKENIRLEFKEAVTALPGNLFETIGAMLNGDGGDILLGVQNNGTVMRVNKTSMPGIVKCNMPVGMFSLLQGRSNVVGEALVKHAKIKAADFTSPFRGGKALYDIAVKRAAPISVYAEMSSVNPVDQTQFQVNLKL